MHALALRVHNQLANNYSIVSRLVEALHSKKLFVTSTYFLSFETVRHGSIF